MWTDNETSQDFLNFGSVARTVAEVIEQAQSRPISIGVSGAWGVGKSSMIKLIRSELENRAKSKEPQLTSAKESKQAKFIFVEFNAWLYQGYDDARAALIDVVASALAVNAAECKTGIEKTEDLLRRVNWFRAIKLTAGTAASLALGLPPAGLIGEIWGVGKKVFSGEIDQGVIDSADASADKVGKSVEGAVASKRD